MRRADRAGFILVYVAVMLAIVGLLLLQLGRLQSPSPLYIERQIAHVLQRNEQHMLLEFVLAGMRRQTLQSDPRYLQFQRMLANAPRPPSELDEQVAWLKAALAQLGMKVEDSRQPSPASWSCMASASKASSSA